MLFNKRAQTAIEYLLLLAVVAAVVMVSFRALLPKTQATSQQYFNSVSRAIIGGGEKIGSYPDGTPRYSNDPAPINGGWCGFDGKPLNNRSETCNKADLPCGAERLYRQCACPEPAFGGAHCMDMDAAHAYVVCGGAPSASCSKECTPENDVCDAQEPTNCMQVTAGLTRCSKKACTKSAQCGSCLGSVNESVAGECPGATVDVPEGSQWQIVDNLSNCADNQIKCRKYRNP